MCERERGCEVKGVKCVGMRRRGEMKLNKSGKRSIYTPCLTYSARTITCGFPFA